MKTNARRWRTSEAVQSVAREMRSAPTQAEAALWVMLRACRPQGLLFRRQAPVGPFVLDFFCASARLAVEVDGGVHDAADTVRRDAERTEILEQAFGIAVLRVRNEEVLLHPQETVQRIQEVAQERKGPHPAF